MTDAADDTFARLTEYEPVYQMDVAAGALELGFGTSQDDERVSLSRVDSMLLECEDMVSTIKVGMGCAKSTYLRNHTFKSPVTRTDTRS